MDTSFLPKFSSNTSGLAPKLITACSVRAEPQTHIIPSEQPWEQWRSSCSNGSCSEQQVPPWPLHESIQDPETQRKSRTETIRHSLGLWKLEIYAAVRFLRGGGWYTWHLVGDGCPPSLFPGFPIPASQLEPGTAPQGTSTRHPNPTAPMIPAFHVPAWHQLPLTACRDTGTAPKVKPGSQDIWWKTRLILTISSSPLKSPKM